MNTEKYMKMSEEEKKEYLTKREKKIKEWQALPEKEKEKRIIADNLKSARQKYNMTRAEVARRLEIPYRTLEDWEAGKSKPAKYVQNMYLKALVEIQPKYTIFLDNEIVASKKTLAGVKEFFKENLTQCFDSKEEFEHFENFNRELRYAQDINDIMELLEEAAAGEAVLYRIEREED